MIFRNDLIEAYKGVKEQELEAQRPIYDKYIQDLGPKELAVPGFDYWVEPIVEEWIAKDLPRERLAVYCEWNGIIGFSETLFDIAQGGRLNGEVGA